MAAEAAVGSGSTRADPAPWWSRYLRHKRNIPPETLVLLLIVACLPLLLAFARVLAFPGVELPPLFGLDQLRDLGQTLNGSLSLRWVPPDDRQPILYLLFLPTGALLVALARLTFGLQVLGLRAILIAIGFQEIGFLPSFALMLVVVGVVVAIRPSMRSIRLPLYARITVILCIVATIMVAALLIGPLLHSQAVWSVAFFPVIIMAMLADAVARTLARDDVVKAVWRLSWTIIVALVLALIGQSTVVGAFALDFPELILTQLIAIILIAEFLDLRLLEQWPARLSRLIKGVRPWYREKPRVAFVRNRWSNGVIGRLGRRAPDKYRKRSIQSAVDALRGHGFEVRVFEADMGLLGELKDFLPPHPRTNAPGGLVFNLATGVQGEGRFCQVPAMLEMAGVAYTGPDPIAHAHLIDRYVLMSLLRKAGVRVPRFSLISDVRDETKLGFPVAVRPRREPDAARVVADDREALKDAVRRLLLDHRDVLIEEHIPGREYRVALIGNDTIECLPLLEYSAKQRRKVCPAPLDDAQAWQIRECASRAYRAAGCRDYARIDIRLSKDRQPVIVDVTWVDLFARRGSFVLSAEAAGYGFGDLIRRIVDVTSLRYTAPPPLHEASDAQDRSTELMANEGAGPR